MLQDRTFGVSNARCWNALWTLCDLLIQVCLAYDSFVQSSAVIRKICGHNQQFYVAGSNIWGFKCKILECVVGFVLCVDSGVPSIRQLCSIQCSDLEDSWA